MDKIRNVHGGMEAFRLLIVGEKRMASLVIPPFNTPDTHMMRTEANEKGQS